MKDSLRKNAGTNTILLRTTACVQVAMLRADYKLVTRSFFHASENRRWQFYAMLALVAVLAAKAHCSSLGFLIHCPITSPPGNNSVSMFSVVSMP